MAQSFSARLTVEMSACCTIMRINAQIPAFNVRHPATSLNFSSEGQTQGPSVAHAHTHTLACTHTHAHIKLL